jgi:hypothetical protein
MTPRLPLLAALASIALVLVYVALGGASYTPMQVANPCQPRPWSNPQGAEGLAMQVGLSAVDGAACKLHVSRESLTLALRSRSSLSQFARAHRIDNGQVESALRAGLKRAVDDADRAGAINTVEAFVLRQAVDALPIDQLLDAVRGGGGLSW